MTHRAGSRALALNGRPLVPPLLLLALVLSTAAAEPLGAQGGAAGALGDRRGWTRVRVAKWALLGVTVGFGAYALTHSTRAERAYGDLRRLCVAEPSACSLAAGRYEAPRAEALYRTSVSEDRRAQLGIFGGQAALLGSVALFVYDLRNGRGPANIPYPASRLRAGARAAASRSPHPGVAAGVSLAF